jgi:hypothetical protein
VATTVALIAPRVMPAIRTSGFTDGMLSVLVLAIVGRHRGFLDVSHCQRMRFAPPSLRMVL